MANVDCVRVRYTQLANLVQLRFGRRQLIRRLATLGRFKLTALFKAKTEIVLALGRCRFCNYWPIKDVLNGLLNAAFILRCVVHFECAEVEIWLSSIHTSFNVYGISFNLLGCHDGRVFVLIWLNIAILESWTWNVIALLRNIGLTELSDECHTLGSSFRIVLNAMIREIVSSRCLSLPGISTAHVDITLSSLALIDLLERTNVPFLLSHYFVKRAIRIDSFWIVISSWIA